MSAPRDSWAFRGVSREPYAFVNVLPSTADGCHWISILQGDGLKDRRSGHISAAQVPAFLAREVTSIDANALEWSAYPCARRDTRANGFRLLRKKEHEEQYGTNEDGYVYFVQGMAGGLIKIGHALNVTKRLAELQTGSPVWLLVLATIAGSPVDERAFHRRFQHLRHHGEWFTPAHDLLAVIEAAQQAAREARQSA